MQPTCHWHCCLSSICCLLSLTAKCTSYCVQLIPKTQLTSFSIRLNDAIANNQSLISSARPAGSLQTGFSARGAHHLPHLPERSKLVGWAQDSIKGDLPAGGPQYTWAVNGPGAQTFSLALATADSVNQQAQLTDLCQQNLQGENDAGQVVFTEPPFGSGQPGSCVCVPAVL